MLARLGATLPSSLALRDCFLWLRRKELEPVGNRLYEWKHAQRREIDNSKPGWARVAVMWTRTSRLAYCAMLRA